MEYFLCLLRGNINFDLLLRCAVGFSEIENGWRPELGDVNPPGGILPRHPCSGAQSGPVAQTVKREITSSHHCKPNYVLKVDMRNEISIFRAKLSINISYLDSKVSF